MSYVKALFGYTIHKLTASHQWEGYNLIRNYIYVCRHNISNKVIFESEDLEKAIEFCEQNKINKRFVAKKQVYSDILLDIQSLLQANIPELIKNKNLILTDRVNSDKKAEELLEILNKITIS